MNYLEKTFGVVFLQAVFSALFSFIIEFINCKNTAKSEKILKSKLSSYFKIQDKLNEKITNFFSRNNYDTVRDCLNNKYHIGDYSIKNIIQDYNNELTKIQNMKKDLDDIYNNNIYELEKYKEFEMSICISFANLRTEYNKLISSQHLKYCSYNLSLHLEDYYDINNELFKNYDEYLSLKNEENIRKNEDAKDEMKFKYISLHDFEIDSSFLSFIRKYKINFIDYDAFLTLKKILNSINDD